MPSRRAPKYAYPKAQEEHYWKKPTRYDISDNESSKSSSAESSDDDGEEKIMVERYWKREPSTHKGCEAPSGEEKIIISRLWKKKSTGANSGTGDKETSRGHSNGRVSSATKSGSSNASTNSSDASTSESSSESGKFNSDYGSNIDEEFKEHYWSRRTRADNQRPSPRGSRPAVCQKCGSYKYPRKH
ncbi:unnamed protein product [Hymenolepis diminuta]|uniref:Uncharacterized protein n=1 Tax=Hymenolepis diminuta TaxID=6216 RepID=A0A564ZD44_HYMDI|nr:unnamed protein product [Hymenolepis diminuta]